MIPHVLPQIFWLFHRRLTQVPLLAPEHWGWEGTHPSHLRTVYIYIYIIYLVYLYTVDWSDLRPYDFTSMLMLIMLFLFWPSPPMKGVQNWWYLPGADRNYQVSFTQLARGVHQRGKGLQGAGKGIGKGPEKITNLQTGWPWTSLNTLLSICFWYSSRLECFTASLVQDRCLASRFVRCNTSMFEVEVPNIAHIPTPIPWPPSPDDPQHDSRRNCPKTTTNGSSCICVSVAPSCKKNWSKQKEGMSPSNAVFVRKYGYGSIPINTIFSGLFTSINPSYFDVHQGYYWFWHTAIWYAKFCW